MVRAATSSIEQIERVEKGEGNFRRLLPPAAALISPSADCMPRSPTGAMATGMVTSFADEGGGGGAVAHVDCDALAVNRACRSRKVFSRKVCSDQLPVSQ